MFLLGGKKNPATVITAVLFSMSTEGINLQWMLRGIRRISELTRWVCQKSTDTTEVWFTLSWEYVKSSPETRNITTTANQQLDFSANQVQSLSWGFLFYWFSVRSQLQTCGWVPGITDEHLTTLPAITGLWENLGGYFFITSFSGQIPACFLCDFSASSLLGSLSNPILIFPVPEQAQKEAWMG